MKESKELIVEDVELGQTQNDAHTKEPATSNQGKENVREIRHLDSIALS